MLAERISTPCAGYYIFAAERIGEDGLMIVRERKKDKTKHDSVFFLKRDGKPNKARQNMTRKKKLSPIM